MPLYKSIAVDPETHVLIWKITESEKNLAAPITLGINSTQRIKGMKSQLHRRAYLSIRHLLAIAGYTDTDLTYSQEGKPNLSDGVFISITHSYEFSAIILSAKPVGIDIEKQRDKIERIAHKFVSDKEQEYLSKFKHKIRALTTIWGAKESLYKLYGVAGLSFKQHIEVAPFEQEKGYTKSSIHYEKHLEFYEISFSEFEGFTCVYAQTIDA